MNTNCTDKDTAVACQPTSQVTETFVKPRYRAKEDEQGYRLRVYVPGVGKSGVSISLANAVLTLTAKRSDGAGDSWKALSRELPSDDYQLRLQLDSKVDPDKITAKLEDGVLDVALPLKEADKPRVIDVA